MTKMISKNTTIPTKFAQTFSTADDNQPAVTIKFSKASAKWLPATRCWVSSTWKASPSTTWPTIEVAFDIDANGILQRERQGQGHRQGKQDHHQGQLGSVDEEIQRW